MSTYYSFGCDECKLMGGFYSRQAWGVGNADLIETFKFTMYHALNCGTDHVRMYSEHDYKEDWLDTNSSYGDNKAAREQFLKETEHYMPSSSDWEFVTKHGKDWPKAKELWVKREMEKLDE